jgi:hypothetical protein
MSGESRRQRAFSKAELSPRLRRIKSKEEASKKCKKSWRSSKR